MDSVLGVLVDQGGVALFAALALWALRQSFQERLKERDAAVKREEDRGHELRDLHAVTTQVIRENTGAMTTLAEKIDSWSR